MKDRYTPFTIYSMFVATLASLCSGYNKGVMGGVLSSVKQEFQLTPIDESFLVSIALLGGTLGSLFCGYVSDKFGRKAGLTLTAIFFIIGGLVSAFSTTYSILCIGRFIIGMGLGTMLVVVPLYLVEISPELYRGRFVAFSSIMSSLGILLAYTISDLFEDVWNWRFILSITVFFSTTQLIGLYFIHDTPLWLLRSRKTKQAVHALEVLRRGEEWKNHLKKMKKQSTASKTGGWLEIFDEKHRKITLFVSLLFFFQQATGINAVIFYAPQIISGKLHSTESLAVHHGMEIALINVFFTIFALFIVDKIGRRTLLMSGLTIMGGSLLFYAFSGKFTNPTIAGIMGLVCYVASFAVTLGPLTGLISSEIASTSIRGKVIAFGGLVSWTTNYCISLILLPMIAHIGPGRTFGIFITMSVVAIFFVWKYIPETRGQSLDELEEKIEH